MTTYIIRQDGDTKKTFHHQDDDFQPFKWMIDHQGQSISWAIKYEGWSVEAIDEETNKSEFWK